MPPGDLGAAVDRLRSDLMAEIRALRIDLQSGYMTKDAGTAINEDIKELKEQARAQLAFRRAVIVSVLAAFIGGLFTLATVLH